jgi:hypothetical protein
VNLTKKCVYLTLLQACFTHTHTHKYVCIYIHTYIYYKGGSDVCNKVEKQEQSFQLMSVMT